MQQFFKWRPITREKILTHDGFGYISMSSNHQYVKIASKDLSYLINLCFCEINRNKKIGNIYK